MAADNEAPATGPATKDEDGELFDQIKGWHKDSRDHLGEWREEAELMYGFVAAGGQQWTEEEKNALVEQRRAPIEFNRIAPVIDSVAGMEVGNRQETHYFPRQVGASGVNEMLTNAARFFRDESETEDEESDAFFDTIVCGIGCTETRPDYEEDPEGLIPTERIDPLSAWWDPSARKRNLTDRRYCGYDKEIPLEDAKALFPDADEADLHAAWAVPTKSDSDPLHDATPQLAYNQGDQNRRASEQKKVTIVYVEWWEREKYHIAVDPISGQRVELSTADASKLKSRHAKIQKLAEGAGQSLPPLQITPALTRKAFKQAFLGAKVLSSGPGRCPHDFTLNFITGKRDRNKNTWYGIVRAMVDPQRWANKFLSTLIHQISTAGKGIVLEKDAVENVRQFEADWAKADAVKWVRQGGIAKMHELQGAAPNAAVNYLLQFAISSVRDTTGVNLEMLGLADREQAGVLEYQRKQSGMTILAGLFDSLRRYRKQQGKALLYIIVTHIPPGRLIRIDGENGPQYAPLVKDPNVTKYDVIVDESPHSPNQKEATWGMLTQMMPFLAKANLPGQVWAELIKYSPLPDTLSTKVGQALAQQQQPIPPEVQAQMEQLTQQLDQQKQQLQQAEIDKAQLKMQGQMKAQEIAADASLKQQQFQMEAAQAVHEANLRASIAGTELQIERTKAFSEIAIQQATAAHQVRQGDEKMQLQRDQAEHTAQLREADAEHRREMDRRAAKEKAKAD